MSDTFLSRSIDRALARVAPMELRSSRTTGYKHFAPTGAIA